MEKILKIEEDAIFQCSVLFGYGYLQDNVAASKIDHTLNYET